MFGSLKLDAEYAFSGEEAIEMIKNNTCEDRLFPYNLIFLDYTMDELNGPETAR